MPFSNFSDLQAVASISVGDQILIRRNNALSGAAGFARIQALSAFSNNLNFIDTGVRALTSLWDSTYSTVYANSAAWASDSTTDGGVRALTATWQSTYTSFNAQSASNESVYTTVNTNSAQWAIDTNTDVGVRALTGNWQSTYSTVNSTSAEWSSVYSTFNSQSASNASTYSTVQTYSAAWTDTAAPTTLTYASSITPSLSDGISRKVTMTGDLTLNAPTNATDGSLWKGRFTASGADRTITLGANIQTPRGTTFSGIVSSGFTRLFEMNYNGTKWWLVRNQEFAP